MFLATTIIQANGDDSSAESGSGQVNTPHSAYYNLNEYGWRVSLFVSKSIGKATSDYLDDSLIDDYYYLGNVTIKNSRLNIDSSTILGNLNKINYVYEDGSSSLSLKTNRHRTCFTFSDCPAPPIVCNGNINAVRSYFLNPNRIPDYLEKIAQLNGKPNGWSLLSDLEFTYIPKNVAGGETITRTGEEWGPGVILPASDMRRNYAPWVLVYEPMICLYLAPAEGSAQRQKVFLTATEFALAQGFVWNWHTLGSGNSLIYNWNGNLYYTGMLTPQCVQSLVFKNLPASVFLDSEKNWFGFDTVDKYSGEAWTADEVIRYGGWGMGFLSPAAEYSPEGDMLLLTPVYPELRQNGTLGGSGVYRRGTDVVSSFTLTNLSSHNIAPEDDYSLEICVYDGAEIDGEPYVYKNEGVCLPGFSESYVWLRWTVGDIHSDVCSIVATVYSIESSDVLTWACFTVPVTEADDSFTPRPVSASDGPPGFGAPYAPESFEDSVSWVEWRYVHDVFVKDVSTVSISGSVECIPDPSIGSTFYEGEVGCMRSGYSVFCTATAEITADEFVSRSAFTGAQSCAFLFPEFGCGGYSREYGEYEAAETVDGQFVLREADSGKRAHYTPIWYPDDVTLAGNYTVVAEIGDCWTPAGELSCRAVAPAISIRGSMYDDWYIGSR